MFFFGLTTGLKRLSHKYFLPKYFFFFRNFSVLAGGRCPPDPPNFGWGGKAPPDPPLNGRSSHLIEAAKRGRLDQMIFFSAPLTTHAPPTTVRRPSDDRPPAVRQPSTVPMILRYLGANLRAGANFKNLPLKNRCSQALALALALALFFQFFSLGPLRGGSLPSQNSGGLGGSAPQPKPKIFRKF